MVNENDEEIRENEDHFIDTPRKKKTENCRQ